MLQVNPEWRELSCFMKDNNHPLLLLQPIKVEELKKDPYMVLFHDFFNDHEIENTKELAKPRVCISVLRGGARIFIYRIYAVLIGHLVLLSYLS